MPVSNEAITTAVNAYTARVRGISERSRKATILAALHAMPDILADLVAKSEPTGLDAIESMRRQLANTAMPWENGDSAPANRVQRTADGRQLAIVDRWCGGYQNPSYPVLVGWKAHQVGGCFGSSGLVMVDYGDLVPPCRGEQIFGEDRDALVACVDAAIAKAERQASRAVRELNPNLEFVADHDSEG